MDKEEKEIETPSNSAKGGVKKRTGGSSTGVVTGGPVVVAGAGAGAGAATLGARTSAVKPLAPAPHPAFVGSTNTTTTPTLTAPSATPPATHTGLPQQVLVLFNFTHFV